MIKEHSLVTSNKKLSPNVNAETVGVVLIIYTIPRIAYEVEFFDDDNESIDVLTVNPEDLDICKN